MNAKSRLKEAYDKYFADVYNNCLLLTEDAEQAETLMADTFVYLYKAIERGVISGETNIKSFLITTSRQFCINHIKNILRNG